MSKSQLKTTLATVKKLRRFKKERWDRQLSIHLMSKCQRGHPKAGGHRQLNEIDKHRAGGEPTWEGVLKRART